MRSDRPIIFKTDNRWTVRLPEGFDFQRYGNRIWRARHFCSRLNWVTRFQLGTREDTPAPVSGRYEK